MSSAHRWKRAVGAGAKHRLVLVDRLLAKLGIPAPKQIIALEPAPR
ncbi:hypothetical protein [Streptomyces prasinus]